MEEQIACPECNSEHIYWDYACHTWPKTQDGRTIFMSCLPCDSAIEYRCYDCTWAWNAHLNPKNPRSEENDFNKPDWYVEPEQGGWMLLPMEGIIDLYDMPEDWD